MTIDPEMVRRLREALDAADGQSAAEALPHLRAAAEGLAALIDDALRRGRRRRRRVAPLGRRPRRAVGERRRAAAGPHPAPGRLRRRQGAGHRLGVERARYDAETGAAPPAAAARPSAPMRFKPRRPTT